MFLHENDYNYDSYKIRYKSAFILFLSFLRNKKKEPKFHQVGGLITRNISTFCLKWVALYFKSMLNSIPFYNGIFLHVIPVHIIVPCTNCTLTEAFVQNFLRKKVVLKNSGKIWGCPCLYRYELEINRSAYQCRSFVKLKIDWIDIKIKKKYRISLKSSSWFYIFKGHFYVLNGGGSYFRGEIMPWVRGEFEVCWAGEGDKKSLW